MRIEKIQTLEEVLKTLFQPNSTIFSSLKCELKLNDILDSEFQECLRSKKVLITYKTTGFLLLALIKTIGVAKEVCLLRNKSDNLNSDQDFNFDVHLSELSELISVEKKNRTQPKAIETNILIYTSGTTGRPKLVCRSFDSLTNSVKKRSSNSEEVIWGLCYDPEKFAGLQVILQAFLSGSSICGVDDYGKFSFKELLEIFSLSNCSAISATPSFWRILFSYKELSLLDLKFITLGGEIVTQDVLDKAIKFFPNAKITHIYASTEAGVGFSVKDCKDGFPAEYIDSPRLTAKLKIIDNELHIKSNRIGAYVNISTSVVNSDGYIPTGDLVTYNQDKSRVFFLGRKNKSMNIGGKKVMPEEIERVADCSPYIKISKAYSVSHSLLGNVVALDYVKDLNCSLSSAELKKHITLVCRDELERHKIPIKINEVKDIKLSGSGKVVRE